VQVKRCEAPPASKLRRGEAPALQFGGADDVDFLRRNALGDADHRRVDAHLSSVFGQGLDHVV